MSECGTFEHAGVSYHSLKRACTAIGVSVSAVRSWSKKYKISAQEAFRLYAERGLVRPRGFWTEERVNILRENYPKQGAEIPELLALTTRAAIRSRAQALGITKEGQVKRALQYRGKVYTKSQITSLFGLSTTTIDELCVRLGCDEQHAVDYLDSCFESLPDGTVKKLADRFGQKERYYVHEKGKRWTLTIYCRERGLDADSIVRYFQRSGCSADEAVVANRKGPAAAWTSEEDEILRSRAPASMEEIQSLLPNRSVSSIRNRAFQLGVIVYVAATGAPTSVTRHVADVQTSALAFVSETGIVHLFVKCGKCGSVMLCNVEDASSFSHGECCVTNQVPEFVKTPV